MNNLRNRVQLIGNLGMNPEVTEFDGGRSLAKFSIATRETYKNAQGEKVENTQWHNLVAWGAQATFAQKYLKKGNEVAVEGKLKSRTYDDKNGVKRYITEIIINEILLLKSNDKKK